MHVQACIYSASMVKVPSAMRTVVDVQVVRSRAARSAGSGPI